MRLSVILGVCVVLCGALAANAYTLPVVMTGGNITVEATRTVGVAPGYDEVDFYLTGMLGLAAGLNTDGTPAMINIVEGRWTAPAGGSFWVNSGLASLKTNTTNSKWQQPTFSAVNFDSIVSAATIWTNNAGGGGRLNTGSAYQYFSGSWYGGTSFNDLIYPARAPNTADLENGDPANGYVGPASGSTFIAALYVTSATPDAGIAYGLTPYSAGASGKFSFTYCGGTVENVGFYTTAPVVSPEPGTLVLLAGGLMGLVAYAWRKRK